MVNTPNHLRANIASLLEYAHHDTHELEDIEVKILKNPASPLSDTHSFLTVEFPHHKTFLITIEEV